MSSGPPPSSRTSGGGWYEVWGVDAGCQPPRQLLLKFPASVTTRDEVEKLSKKLVDDGVTELEIREVGTQG